jgi:L,D-transpeptidase catalytic domain/Putative peptidoglycan binding domain
VLKTIVALLAAAGAACAAAPAAERMKIITPGVSVAGIRVGGLSSEPARHKVGASFARPLVIVYKRQTIVVSPNVLGASAAVDRAVASALATTTRRRIPLRISVSDRRVTDFVDKLARRYDRKPKNAAILGADASGPLLRPGEAGLAVRKATMHAALAQELTTGSREVLHLLTEPVAPAKTIANFGPVIVIDRQVNSLRLYDAQQLVRTLQVATGQARYPTPSGMFDIVTMQRDPWWYPPTYDDWAKDLKPVPPGPGNPLGTRWMGISAPGVGIHGTNSETSIGYSVSHGCIRMHVPDAEWLFDQVRLGTPVVIL